MHVTGKKVKPHHPVKSITAASISSYCSNLLEENCLVGFDPCTDAGRTCVTPTTQLSCRRQDALSHTVSACGATHPKGNPDTGALREPGRTHLIQLLEHARRVQLRGLRRLGWTLLHHDVVHHPAQGDVVQLSRCPGLGIERQLVGMGRGAQVVDALQLPGPESGTESTSGFRY